MSDPLPGDAGIVLHNTADSRYEVEVDGRLAVADYTRQGDVIVMTHTYVPPELRGRGLAEQLVRRALTDAQAAHLRVVPACSYVATFIRRHPEFSHLVDS